MWRGEGETCVYGVCVGRRRDVWYEKGNECGEVNERGFEKRNKCVKERVCVVVCVCVCEEGERWV